MNVLDLFSGIGGFSLGLERAGMRTVAFCEIEPYCRKVLAKHWPNVPCYGDIRELTAERLRADGISVDLICGGFPCQDISTAGKGAGLKGARSGLWSEFARLIGELRPRFAIVENVSALLSRGLGTVLGDLAALGFDAEWHCIPASYVGAPHRRDRVWIVAYPAGQDARRGTGQPEGAEPTDGQSAQLLPDSRGHSQPDQSEDVAHAEGERRGETRRDCERSEERFTCGGEISNSSSKGLEGQREIAIRTRSQQYDTGNNSWWESEPNVGRVAHGVPSRVDRLRSLGNAVVPQIPEIIGRAIMSIEKETP